MYGVEGRRVTVLVTDGAEMRRLNKEFRGIDSSTDVLSFPSPSTALEELGDVAVNIEMAQAQARVRRVRVADETAMLAVHGTLHLLGHDDVLEADRAEMVAKMNAVMRASGLPEETDWASLPHEEHA